ncbi:MAG TPA: Panacea domain-containing protein [Thermoanaerobaculia bacterium]|jgi:hypothetical protein|nr:Panacea domain-containing protein [Thermoanaerobaculia bacterium]
MDREGCGRFAKGVNSAIEFRVRTISMTTIQENAANDGKMKELILYLAARSEKDPRFSSTKLNKLLFYCDFLAYRRWGRSITGHSYWKLRFGPAPKAMLPILRQMQKEGDCEEIRRDYYGREQRRVAGKRAPKLCLFSPEELGLADQIVEALWENSATEVSDLSHDFIGWKVAALNEVIPYETVFVGDPAAMPVTEDEIEFCRQLEREAG